MDYDNITAGIDPGGLKKIYEIRILICFLLNFVNKPLSKSQINDIFQMYGMVNYFTYSQAINDLIKDHHLETISNYTDSDDELLQLTSEGKRTADIFNGTIAITIKEKLTSAAQEYLQLQKTMKDNVVTIDKVEDGYMVKCKIKDIGSDLMTLWIFSPDRSSANNIKQRFISDSQNLYKHIFEFLTNDKN